jgi:DUF971 family protein
MAEVEPTEVRAPTGARMMEIDWSDETTSFLSHRLLRGFCPCAVCQGHHGPVGWVAGTDGLPAAAFELRDLAASGQYALRMAWADGHNTGIYSFEYLRRLGALHDERPEDVVRLVLRADGRVDRTAEPPT